MDAGIAWVGTVCSAICLLRKVRAFGVGLFNIQMLGWHRVILSCEAIEFFKLFPWFERIRYDQIIHWIIDLCFTIAIRFDNPIMQRCRLLLKQRYPHVLLLQINHLLHRTYRLLQHIILLRHLKPQMIVRRRLLLRLLLPQHRRFYPFFLHP